ncbi:MAG TPA: uroporphyrinogen decarboxylase [Ktedonobacterales bacterium]|nr:uroporphyrinogen decarboxylase [Ktedonobacterales bacterium]
MNTSTNRFLRACQRLPVDHTPVWFMRQAGRSLPEFRAIRQRHTFFEVANSPELCAEVTLQPVRRLGVDAAILFSDIMAPLVAVGLEVALVEGVGPTLATPLRTQADLARLRPLDPDADMRPVRETLGMLRAELASTDTALIGFVGAPFKLAGYLVEGKPSRDFIYTKQMMFDAPDLWDDLMRRLTDIVVSFARGQIAAGAQAMQVFDSWIGALGPREYARYVQPHMRRLFDGLRAPDLPEVPRIHFGTGTAALLEQMAEAGGEVIGLDWRVNLDEAWVRLGGTQRIAIQGNLDPVTLTASWETIQREAEAILRQAGGQPGHIFNLGHGVLPSADPANIERLVRFIHDFQVQ